MKRKVAIIQKNQHLERAEYCTKYLENFECTCRNWVDLAGILIEMEDEELLSAVGAKGWDEWAKQHAPISYRLCYMIKARYKALKGAFSTEELKRIPPETAQWASKAKNISPAALSKPEVKEALMLPRRKAIKILKAALPEQHIEEIQELACKFTGSQHDVIQRAYQTFRVIKDEHASFEEFVEFCVTEWILATSQVSA